MSKDEENRLVNHALDIIKEIMLSDGQKDLADALGVSPERISQMLAPNKNMSLRMLARAGKALGVRFTLNAERIK